LQLEKVMQHKTVWSIALCTLALSVAGISWGDIRDPYTRTVETTNPPTRTVIVGVTLGADWAGFPELLEPDFRGTAWWEYLDAELPLYVTWIVDWNHTGSVPEPQHLDPPQSLASFSWFSSHYDEFVVALVAQSLDSSGYKSCPEGVGLEAPVEGTHPLTAAGKLRVTDRFGGIGDITRIVLTRDVCCLGGVNESYTIEFQWDRPGTWYDWQQGIFLNFAPEMTRHDRFNVNHGPSGSPQVHCWMPTRIVQWPSGDIGVPGSSASPSPRYVDSSDMAYFAAYIPGPVRYGFAFGESPVNSPTYQCDVNPFSQPPWIDSSDLTVMARHVDTSCQVSKTGGESEAAAILKWFGIALTGGMVAVGPNRELVPEYDIVDWDQNRRAVADPYGYRNTVNSATARQLPWGLVKQLYR
jgi:hypothetical protein